MINDIEKEILHILYKARNERPLEAGKVYKEMNIDVKRTEIEHHLENLKEKKYVRTKKITPVKTGPYKVAPYDTYEINSNGAELVESDFKLEKENAFAPSVVIYGNNIHLGDIFNTNINITDIIAEVAKEDEEKEEMKKIMQEIDEEVEKDVVSKSVLKRLFEKIAEKGFDKLTDAAFVYIGSKIMGL